MNRPNSKKIEKLTPEQEESLPGIAEEWIATGLSTERANRPEAEAGVRLAYEAAGLTPPPFIIWVDSPYAGAFAQGIAPHVISKALNQVGAQVGAQVYAQVGAQVYAQVGAQVRDQVGDQVGDQVRDQVGDQVGAQVGAQVRDQVGAQVYAQVGAQVYAQVRAQVGDQVRAQVGDQVGAQVGDQVYAQVGAQVGDQVGDQVRAQVGDQVGAQVGDQVRDQVGAQVYAQVGAQVYAQVRAQVGDQVRAQVGDQVRDQVRDQVYAQVGAQVGDQVGDQVRAQVRDQVYAQVYAQVGDQVRDQVGDQVGDQVRDQVYAQVRAQVGDQVHAQVGDQVHAQVHAQVRDQVYDQVDAQVYAQVGDQVRDQVRDQVYAQVGAQVGDQVGDQVRAQVRAQVYAQVRAQVRDWSRGLISDYYGVYWSAWFEAMQRLGVAGLGAWAGQEAVARNAYWWWAFRGYAVLSERPVVINRDAQGRLHSENDHAIRWPDGWGFHAWHGTRLDMSPIEIGRMSPDEVLKERNAEVRRCMIEIVGWDVVTERLTLVAEADDPGNAPHRLGLYDLPDEMRDMYAADARILLCTNGTVERDGSRRRFGLPVPAEHSDPVAAAADLYGMPVAAYRQLEVRR